MTPVYYDHIPTPIGDLLAACEPGNSNVNDVAADAGKALIGLWFAGQKYEAQPEDHWQRDPNVPLLKRVRSKLDQYFSDDAETSFDLPMRLHGTTFQQSVWRALLDIKHGETITYGQLAERLGKPAAVRAAAAAVGRNPVSVMVPCHRVLGANGSLTGYAGGLDRKRFLLEQESVLLPLA